MREDRLLERVELLLQEYQHQEPLSRFLKQYFTAHRNMGARDRRETRSWIFNYFRIGTNLPDRTVKDRLAVANFLCCNQSDPALAYLLSDINGLNPEDLSSSPDQKIAVVQKIFPEFDVRKNFPFKDELSSQFNQHELGRSILQQPKVWFRVREQFMDRVITELETAKILFEQDTQIPNAFASPSGSSLQKLESFRKGWFEIQDRSSQLTQKYFKPTPGQHWWDACAGSGGKSLLLLEAEPNLQLLATDVRESILVNLKERTTQAGFHGLNIRLLNAAEEKETTGIGMLDGILADVPCSGSGTWGRTPEWLNHFVVSMLDSYYVPLQKKLVSNLVKHLKPGGVLVYITCSVFHAENEDNIDYFVKTLPLKKEESQYLSGIKYRADSMFVSRLVKV